MDASGATSTTPVPILAASLGHEMMSLGTDCATETDDAISLRVVFHAVLNRRLVLSHLMHDRAGDTEVCHHCRHHFSGLPEVILVEAHPERASIRPEPSFDR
jgi:hypothetical protein